MRPKYSPKVIAEAMEDDDTSGTFESPGMVEKLSKCMANAYVLSQRAWAFHWNYEGPSFAELHGIFGEVYDDFGEIVDELAERIRALGDFPPASLKKLLDLSDIDDSLSDSTKGAQMIRDLEKGLTEYQDCLREALELASENKDEACTELLSRRLNGIEKWCWKLRSQKS